MKFLRLTIVVAVLGSFGSSIISAKSRTLDIYFIDVEGGGATLIVTPLGESLLVDSGFPIERDPTRIAKVAREVAGLTQIDHYISTHWHRDHFGGSMRLTQLIPIKHYYDHGLPTAPAPDLQPELIEAYRQVTEGRSTTLKPLDEIKFKSKSLQVKILAANATVAGEPLNAPQIRPCGPDFKPAAEDRTDNARSVALLLSFGRFKFFNGGDLTWNVEHKLVCPKNLVGPVDIYQVDHHGMDDSNNPAFISALKPTVALIDNGPRKGGGARTYATLKAEGAAIYQLHRNLQLADKDNAPAGFVANDEEACQGNYIKVSVADNGSYSVSIPAKGINRSYPGK